MKSKLYLFSALLLTTTILFAGSVQAPPIVFEDDGEGTVATQSSPVSSTIKSTGTATSTSSPVVQNDDEEIDLTKKVNKQYEEQIRKEAEQREKELREKEEQQKALEAEKERKRQEAEAAKAAKQKEKEEAQAKAAAEKERKRQEAEAAKLAKQKEKEEAKAKAAAEKERRRQEAEAAKLAKQKEKEEALAKAEAEKQRQREAAIAAADSAKAAAAQVAAESQATDASVIDAAAVGTAAAAVTTAATTAAVVEATPIKKSPSSVKKEASESQPQESITQAPISQDPVPVATTTATSVPTAVETAAATTATTTAAAAAATQLPVQQPLQQGPVQVVVITTNEHGQVTGVTTSGAGGVSYVNTTGNTQSVTTTPTTPPVKIDTTEENTIEATPEAPKNVFQRYYARSGTNSLSIISGGYSTYFLVGQAAGISATRDFGIRHFINFELFEWRVKCFGMQLFNFELGVNTPKEPTAENPSGVPLLYRGGVNPTEKVEATGQTMWFAYKPAIKFYIPCCSWFAFEVYSGIEVDITGAWSKITNSYYQDPKVPQQNFFFDVYAGLGFVLTGVPQLPLEIKAEYRHPFDHVGSTVCNTELVPQGIYLSAQIHLTAPIKKKNTNVNKTK